MTQSILIETDDLLLHPFRAEEMKRFESLSRDIHQLFGQHSTTTFLPHKKLSHIGQAEALLQTALFNQYNGNSQWYFITQKTDQRTIGMIEVITPHTARQHYQLDQYPHFIEFCLSADHIGKGIMSKLLPGLVDKLKQTGIKKIGAIAHPKNLSAIKVLYKSGLVKKTSFDTFQHLYHN